MSGDKQQETHLGASFDMMDLEGVPTTVCRDEIDMKDTATSSVRFVGEVVAESNEVLATLPTQETVSATDLSNIASTS